MPHETTHGCCNATLTAALAAITARIATEQGRAGEVYASLRRLYKAQNRRKQGGRVFGHGDTTNAHTRR
jgi:hypothetical protein